MQRFQNTKCVSAEVFELKGPQDVYGSCVCVFVCVRGCERVCLTVIGGKRCAWVCMKAEVHEQERCVPSGSKLAVYVCVHVCMCVCVCVT